MGKAWRAQSNSLVEVQKRGGRLEKLVQDLMGWKGGNVIYEPAFGYTLQVDCAYPSTKEPVVMASVTYTSPDKAGHSNENKLHLKVGELFLFKRAYPKLRMILVLGGTKEAWLQYVIKAFEYFYDEVVYLWEPQGVDRLKEIAGKPLIVERKNEQLWSSMRSEINSVMLSPESIKPPSSLVRYAVLDLLKQQRPIVEDPKLIENEVARLCMQRSYENDGAEWQSYLGELWQNIEMSRNYFNPLEATVEISLQSAGLLFEGGVARDVKVPSLLHSLGMPETSVSEDFVLHSEALDSAVYIQCKSSGGGRDQHGKNIQNRTKEQIARSIIYRCSYSKGRINWGPKKFHWIAVLDGDWGVSRRTPLKYIHMLQLAGYDKIICSRDLLTEGWEVKRDNNPLNDYLINELKCKKAD